MQTIGIGELQKNTAILTNLKEALTIVDKRKNRKVAVVYPINESSENNDIVEQFSKELKEKAKKRSIVVENLEEAKQKALEIAMREKYGLSN